MVILFGILALIFLAIIILQVRNTIPRIISFLNPGKQKLSFEASPQPPSSEARQQAIQPIIDKLAELGFIHQGIMVDKLPLWGRGSREMVMTSDVGKTIASLGFRGNRLSYYFYTPFTGGQIVITAYNAFRDYRRNDFVAVVVVSGDVEEMLKAHIKNVEDFINKGYIPFAEYSRESVIKATTMYYNSPYPRRQLQIAGIINLIVLLLTVVIFALLVRGAVG